jgi:nucleoside-diphosphate-sugar epimerase
MATQFSRTSGIPFIGLRFSNIMEPTDYEAFPSFWDDPLIRKWNLWGYVDVRDVTKSVRLALDASTNGSEIAIVAAADTVMTRPSAELMAEVYPGVPLRRNVEGRVTLLAIDRARALLGYEPDHSWRESVS